MRATGGRIGVIKFGAFDTQLDPAGKHALVE